MSIFSKLFGGDAKAEKAARDLLNGLVNGAANSQKEAPSRTGAAAPAQSAVRPEPVRPAEGPSGFSWGPVMPAEENQFNFNGTYDQYFERIYRAEFPAYRLARETPRGRRATVFTFWDGGRKALVVELLAQSSASRKLRTDCARAGIPYLRFYYDHEGWWNTRAYVVTRTRNALAG